MGKVDTFIGETFLTPVGGELLVKGSLPNLDKKPGKYYVCECSICSLDTELFPDPFTMKKGHLKSGRFPCGCSPSKWTEYQQKVRIVRECIIRGYVFFGFAEEFNGIYTKLNLYNPMTDNLWNSCTVVNFLRGNGDPLLRKLAVIAACKRVWVGRTKPSVKGGILTIISESKVDNKITLFCTECSKDPELFGDGTFVRSKNDWNTSEIRCGCGIRRNFSEEQYLTVLRRRRCEVEGISRTLGFTLPFKDGTQKITQECLVEPEHKTWSGSTASNALGLRASGCPSCAKGGYSSSKGANFYIVEWFSEEGATRLLKFGITNKEVLERIRNQNSASPLSYKILYEWHNTDGGLVADTESFVKRLLKPLRTVSKPLLPDGYTEAIYYDQVVLDDMVTYLDGKLNSDNTV